MITPWMTVFRGSNEERKGFGDSVVTGFVFPRRNMMPSLCARDDNQKNEDELGLRHSYPR